MGQHTNVTPMNEQQRVAYGNRLRLLATSEAQSGAQDPEAAAAFLKELADQYDPPLTCPFDRGDHGLGPDDPCPVCGDLGTFVSDFEEEPVSRCVAP